MGKFNKRRSNRIRREFLLTLFPDKKEEYAVLPMNGFVLQRRWNGSINRWEVAIFTEKSFNKMQQRSEGHHPLLLHRRQVKPQP